MRMTLRLIGWGRRRWWNETVDTLYLVSSRRDLVNVEQLLSRLKIPASQAFLVWLPLLPVQDLGTVSTLTFLASNTRNAMQQRPFRLRRRANNTGI
jgi:hypothetical protein